MISDIGNLFVILLLICKSFYGEKSIQVCSPLAFSVIWY
jgi:hypothetical protein